MTYIDSHIIYVDTEVSVHFKQCIVVDYGNFTAVI